MEKWIGICYYHILDYIMMLIFCRKVNQNLLLSVWLGSVFFYGFLENWSFSPFVFLISPYSILLPFLSLLVKVPRKRLFLIIFYNLLRSLKFTEIYMRHELKLTVFLNVHVYQIGVDIILNLTVLVLLNFTWGCYKIVLQFWSICWN